MSMDLKADIMNATREAKECFYTDGTEHIAKRPRTDAVDIHKIIDDAMAKGDRSVSIIIHNGITSVEVRPYVEEKVQWIHTLSDALVCSDCGHILTDYIGPIPVFCGHCGEKMHGVREEITD